MPILHDRAVCAIAAHNGGEHAGHRILTAHMHHKFNAVARLQIDAAGHFRRGVVDAVILLADVQRMSAAIVDTAVRRDVRNAVGGRIGPVERLAAGNIFKIEIGIGDLLGRGDRDIVKNHLAGFRRVRHKPDADIFRAGCCFERRAAVAPVKRAVGIGFGHPGEVHRFVVRSVAELIRELADTDND